MKKKLARFLVKWAQRLNPAIAYEDAPNARQMGITLHIAKKDVREWRKEHPECKSHRQGLKSIIEEARWQVAGAIGRGLMEKKCIFFNVKSTQYIADVSGSIYIYAPEENDKKEDAGNA